MEISQTSLGLGTAPADESSPKSGGQPLRLHTHFLIFTLLMLVSVLTSGVLFSLRVQDDQALENVVRRDLHLLAVVARMRSQMRQIDLLFEVNARTKDPEWTDERRRRVARLMEPAQTLSPGRYGAEMDALMSRLQDQLSTLQGGRERESETARRGVYETLNAVTTSATAELESALDKTHRTTVHRMMVRLGIELLAALLIAFYLYYFMVAPISEIERTSKEWTVGQPWNPRPMPAIPEIRRLLTKFSESATSVNTLFRKEHELNDFKTRLVSLVTHEFGNGLSVIVGAAYLLEESCSPQELEKKGKFIGMISNNAKALNREVLNLLNMSRLEAGKLAISFTKTPADDILRGVVNRLALLAEKKKLDVRLEIADGIPPIEADPSTLALVISNLLTNAIKYTPDGGRVDVGVSKEPGPKVLFRFYVQDTGIGISDEDRAKIFGGDGYFRTESGRKMTAQGFGIGLSLAKQIVEAHGSALELESAPGKGSRFSFLLPAWKAG
jgi:signal transduction histidine kinase